MNDSDPIVIKQLDMELFGGCNFTCDMCPQSTGREKSFLRNLPIDLFKKSLDDAIQYGLEAVSLHGSGEPTLNKNMPEMVKIVKDRGLRCISFSNGYRLDEGLSRELIAAGLDLMRVSCVGYDRPSFKKWMGVDGFEQVRENVKTFVRLIDEMDGDTEMFLYHLITDIEQKDHEIEQYRRQWIDYTGAPGEIWLMHNWTGQYDSPYQREDITSQPVKRSCGRPFSPILQVRAGGLKKHKAAVVACCVVLGRDSEAVLGHLDDQSIKEIYNGDAFKELRAAHREGRFDDIPYCKDCDMLYDVPESLVWTNIPGRQYGKSSVAQDLDHREFAPEAAAE